MKACVLINVLFIYCQIALTQQQDDASGEGDSWKQLTETYTHEGTDYIVFTQRVTWEEAKVVCPSFEGQLAMHNSKSCALFISKQLASSELVDMNAIWLGARKYPSQNWTWNNGEEVPEQRGSDWPLWTRSQYREGKNCMALTLRHHKEPVFTDFDCGLSRPFICERSAKQTTGYPVPASWITHKGVQYVLYQARLNWYKAVAFCRSHGQRIAKFRDPTIGNVIKGAMTKSRPALEMVWIGGHRMDKKWVWVTDGTELPSDSNRTTNYPSWMVESETTKGDCLIFDQHGSQEGEFVALSCTRKRSFACEEYDSLTDDGTSGQTLEFPCGDQTCILVDIKLDWIKARQYCQTHYTKDLVQLINMAQTLEIVDAMDDHVNEIRHAWIGGYRLMGDAWKWLDNSTIPAMKASSVAGEEHSFPPWCDLSQQRSTEGDDLCLNLDRAEYREASMYGMACNDTQAFVCVK